MFLQQLKGIITIQGCTIQISDIFRNTKLLSILYNINRCFTSNGFFTIGEICNTRNH